MLREIMCKRFRTSCISFTEGLNVVLGDENATNSIGKSTLLMVIDFAFGGNSLLEYNTDLVEELDNHDYYFVFEFDKDEYRFRRGTLEPEKVYRCDPEFQPEAVITNNQYTAFLKQCYIIGLDDLSFRSLVGLYSRVWGKQNLNVHKPLHIVPNMPASECVINLIKTYDRFHEIKMNTERLAEIETKRKAMSAAVRADVLLKVRKTDYSHNNVKIAQLERELQSIKSELAKYATNLSELVSDEILDLKFEKDDLIRLKTPLEGRLRRTRRDLTDNRHIKSKHFASLVALFPEIDEKRLAKVEEFHSGLATALRAELMVAEKEALSELKRVDEAILSIEEKMAETLAAVDEPTHLIDIVYNVATELGRAREQNALFEGEQAILRGRKILQEALTTVKSQVLSDIQRDLNVGMRDIVQNVFGPDRKSPSITLTEKSYSFEVFEDTGTGTAYAGLLVFDLTVFSHTALPTLVHDSVLFKNVENDSVARLVEFYPKSGKQAFIAIDEIEKYGEAAMRVLLERSVIRLDDDHLLYDKDWRTTE